MTLNINYTVAKHGPWAQRREKIVRAIRDAGPDVVALQAVAENGGEDQAQQLAGQLPGYTPLFVPVDGTGSDRKGLAFLHRSPVLEKRVWTLEAGLTAEDSSPRSVAGVALDTAQGPCWILNAHLSWVPSTGQRNVEELLEIAGHNGTRGLIVGDFNMEPAAAPVKKLRSRGWVDCWARLHSEAGGFTFEADRPDRRIDYVWSGGTWKDKVSSVKLVGGPDPDWRFSDHLGLLASVEA